MSPTPRKSNLDHFAINQIIGGKMVAGARAGFGNFLAPATAIDMLRGKPVQGEEVSLTSEDDRLIAEAFEQIRNGNPADRLLWDAEFAAQFHRQVCKLGVNTPDTQLTRRIILIGKDPEYCRRHGIVISKTTAKKEHSSIVPKYSHAIEFSLIRLKYRYGESVDNILSDPAHAMEYERLVRDIAGNLKSRDIRLGAIYIRKARHASKREWSIFNQINAKEMEKRFIDFGSLGEITLEKLSEGPGLLELVEPGRRLYIAYAENIREVASELVKPSMLKAIGNSFWRPQQERIHIKVYDGAKHQDHDVKMWQRKLIADLQPVLNLPIHRAE